MRYIITMLAIYFALIGQICYAYTSPGKPTSFINDFANVLSIQTKTELEQTLSVFAKEKNHEISVVTIKTLNGDAIEEYANTLFREWGIGKKEYNNGALFLVVIDDRKMRIEVGYGLEGALTDLASKHIQDDIVRPLFKEGKYDEGIREGTSAIMRVIEGEVVGTTSKNKAVMNGILRHGGEILFLLIFFLSWIASILGRTKSWWLGGVIGGVTGGIVALVTSVWMWLPLVVILGLVFDFFVSKNYSQHSVGGPAWWAGGTWGGWDRWGGGGGFGGFGGGSSGGGGSSSGW